jgi:hypothetical protein
MSSTMRSFSRSPSVLVRRASLSILAILLALVSSPKPTQSQVNCSTTQYSCNGILYESPAPSGEHSCSSGPPWDYGYASLSWNFAGGNFVCNAGSNGGASANASLSTTALYTVTNLPIGTPVLVRFRFTVIGSMAACDYGPCGGADSVSISGPGAQWSAHNFGYCVDEEPAIQVIEMQFTGLAGEPFGITCNLYVLSSSNIEGSCGTTLDGHIDFYDVPAGAMITPCLGSITAVEEPRLGTVEAPLLIRSVAPNPFNSSTTILFQTGLPGALTLEIYDLCGRRLRTVALGGMTPGLHRAIWDRQDGNGSTVASGIYFLRLRSAAAQSQPMRTVVIN